MSTLLRRISIILFLTFSLSSCFDYAEKVIFNRDLSGKVEFDYTVPVYEADGRSVISHLPVDVEGLLEKYERYIRKTDISIKDFKASILPSEPGLYPFKKRVQYSIEFKDPTELKNLLAGTTTIYSDTKGLRLQRSLPSVKTHTQQSSYVMDRYDSITSSVLSNHFAEFYVVVPPGFALHAESGEPLSVTADTFLFRMPLTGAGSQSSAVIWNMTLTPVRKKNDFSDVDAAYPGYEADS